jgi:hypothetical protein
MIHERGYTAWYRVLCAVQAKMKESLFEGLLLVRLTIAKVKQPVNGKEVHEPD